MICFAGYVLRLCPFEDVAMVGLAADDVEAFLQVEKFSSNFSNNFFTPSIFLYIRSYFSITYNILIVFDIPSAWRRSVAS